MACQGGNTNSCNSSQETCGNSGYQNNFNFIIIIVLYILLAIILGAWIW